MCSHCCTTSSGYLNWLCIDSKTSHYHILLLPECSVKLGLDASSCYTAPNQALFFDTLMESQRFNLINTLQLCIKNKSYFSSKLLHARIFRLLLSSDTFLSNLLIDLYSKCGNITSAYQVFDKMPHKNIFSWNAILSAFCKNTTHHLKDACDLFLRMPERNTVSLNTIIGAMVRAGYERQALDTYEAMMWEGVKPSNITFATVFSACGSLLDAECGRRNHGLVVKLGLDGNIYVVNSLLCAYAKCGLTEDALRVFRDVAEPNEVTFTTMMGGLAQTNQVREALEMFRLMLRKGVHVDSVSLSSVLSVCAKGGSGEREDGVSDQSHGLSTYTQGNDIHALSVKLGFERDLHLSNSLLDMYAKIGNMDSAENIFVNLDKQSVVSWNIMIAGYGNKCNGEKAAEYFWRMQCYGYEPDDVTYINMLAACVKSGDVEMGRQIFDCMPCPSLISWNAILSVYNQKADHKEAVKLFRKMQFQCQHPDRTSLAIILSSSAELVLLEAGKQVHAASLKFGFYDDVYVVSGLINVYSKCGKIELSKHVFNKVTELDVVCWNSMIAGFSINSLDKDAVSFFKQMRQFGFVPSEFSFATIVSSCAKLSSLFQGEQIHAQIIKDGYADDIFVGSSLIEMYCKCGDVGGARCYFNTMPGKNTVTWNEMIHGYAQNGYGDEAVCLYKDMISSGEKPDDITFIAALTACSHSSLVDEGIEIFNSMVQQFRVVPKLDHYTCIIDCLSRAGRFHEVEVILDAMPCKDDPIVWEVVLSSCRVHANLSLAKRAAEELFRLDPQNSASYVLLANMYSSMGRWDDAKVVRALMSDNQIHKEPGYSWGVCKNDMQNHIALMSAINRHRNLYLVTATLPHPGKSETTDVDEGSGASAKEKANIWTPVRNVSSTKEQPNSASELPIGIGGEVLQSIAECVEAESFKEAGDKAAVTAKDLKLGTKVTAKVYQIRAHGLILDLGGGLPGMYRFEENSNRDYKVADEIRVLCSSFNSKGIPALSLVDDE
ncbi:hypothetical protein RIF29_18700 [Crotalaria pallida]|uniref:S1 motif domain-containing protein n=1 Tax=Crotalaria pallida TaxID=3830 RepID=A0AAN9F0F2_CROPI